MTTKELLPGNTNLRLRYDNRTVQTSQNTTTNPIFSFQTGRVRQGSGPTIVSWRAGNTWIPFVDGVEIIPGSVLFRFNTGPDQSHTVIAGTTIYVPGPPNSPSIGAAKAASAPVDNGDGTYEVTYTLIVENLGNVQLFDVQITDDLRSGFGTFVPTAGQVDVQGEYIIMVGPTITVNSTDPLTPNPSFDGSSDISLLVVSGGGSLSLGETVTIDFTVLFVPDSANAPYANQANATGDTAADGNADGDASDQSDAGTDPDPDGDGDPDEPGENDLTTLTINIGAPIVGLAKAISGFTQTGATTFDADFTLVVENLGTVPAPNVQVTDDLAAAFVGTDQVTVAAGPSMTGGLSGTNVGFDGVADSDLLSGTETLGVGQSVTLTFTVTVDLGTATGPFVNQATATTAATPGAGAFYTDPSDDGSDPDPDGDGNPDEPGENDPTTVTVAQVVPAIGLAKALTTLTQTGDTTFDASFALVVENLGTVPAPNVQVTDDLTAAFANVRSITVTDGPTVTGG